MVYLKDSKIQVQGSAQVAAVFADLLALEDAINQAKEHFFVMHLDTKSRVNMVELISLGDLNSSIVHPRETFRRAVMQGSAAIIVAHNHPSGEPEPSDEDTKVRNLLFEAGNVLGIQLLDHIVFTPDKFFSFRSNSTHRISDTQQEGGEAWVSAYLVTDKSMSVIARSIEHFANLKPQSGANPLWKTLDGYHAHYLTQPAQGDTEVRMAEKLFANLLRFNMISLRERYDYADEFWGGGAMTYEYDKAAPAVAIPVLIDLLDNWQYQSCEGIAVETDFYKLIAAVKADVALEYVKKTKPYEGAVWGIDDYTELDRVKDACVR